MGLDRKWVPIDTIIPLLQKQRANQSNISEGKPEKYCNFICFLLIISHLSPWVSNSGAKNLGNATF